MSGHCRVCHYNLTVDDETMCRRCGRNFSRAELHQVVVLGVFYFLLCRFSYYLVTGNLFSGFWKGNLAGPYDLSAWGRFPVNLADYPLHLVTLGWLLGLVLVVPVLVATLFGHKAGMALAAVGGVFAGLPGLFVVTVPAAYVAGTRLNGRLSAGGSAWLAAGLPLAYALAMTIGTARDFGFAFALAWVVLLGVIVLHVKLALFQVRRQELTGAFLAKIVVPETVAVLLMFYLTVGFDTLEYECVRTRVSSRSGLFGDLPGPDTRSTDPEGVPRLVQERTDAMVGQRDRALREFQHFVEVFPRSSRTALALYEMAELWNMKLYVAGVRPLVTCVNTDRISPEAVDLYKRIVRDFNDSIPAAYARLKLADFAAQHAQVETAARQYEEDVLDVYRTHLPGDYKEPTYSPVEMEMTWRTRRTGRAIQYLAYYHVMKCARLRRDFIRQNSDYNDVPLILYLQADPRQPDFTEATRQIPEWFPNALVVDNVLWDRVYHGGLKLDAMLKLYGDYPHGDVAPTVLLELAARYLKELHQTETGRKYYDLLQSEFASTPQAEQARQELGSYLSKQPTNSGGS